MKSRANCHRLQVAAASWILAAIGCGQTAPESADALDYGRLRSMAGFYESYLRDHGNQPPKDEAAFRAYLQSKQQELQSAGLSVDAMFISPRSGKPLVWSYGKIRNSNMGVRLLGYEAEPADGKRLVIGSRGMFESMDDARYRRLFPSK